MSEAAEKIVLEMQRCAAPDGGWTMPDLRRLTGLSIGNFAAAVAQLRREGRMAAFELALVSPDGAAVVPTLVQQVAAEVQQSTARRDAARTYSHSGYVGPAPTVGAQLQEKALDGAPQMAASIVRDRWGPTWTRLCRHARATGQKPVTAMIALLDKGLDAETIEGASA